MDNFIAQSRRRRRHHRGWNRPRSRAIMPPLWPRAHYAEARGLYRVFNAACYRLYWGTMPPLETDTPQATSATLPFTLPESLGDGTWYFSVSWFNGVLDSGFLPVGPSGETYLCLTVSEGLALPAPPLGPSMVQLSLLAGGVVQVTAALVLGTAGGATQWAIGYTTDGSSPPEGTPDLTAPIGAGAFGLLSIALPAQPLGTLVNVRVQTRRNDGTALAPVWSYSEGSTVESITIPAPITAAPIAGEAWTGKIQ